MILALGLNLLWEIAHLPFYTLWQEGEAWRIVLYVAHCVLGDIMIATLAYLAVALAWRGMDWPVRRPVTGGFTLVVVGLGYTVFSEWLNVHILGSWAYADAMPRLFGLGLTPLLQWIVVPAVMVILVRRGWNPGPGKESARITSFNSLINVKGDQS